MQKGVEVMRCEEELSSPGKQGAQSELQDHPSVPSDAPMVSMPTWLTQNTFIWC